LSTLLLLETAISSLSKYQNLRVAHSTNARPPPTKADHHHPALIKCSSLGILSASTRSAIAFAQSPPVITTNSRHITKRPNRTIANTDSSRFRPNNTDFHRPAAEQPVFSIISSLLKTPKLPPETPRIDPIFHCPPTPISSQSFVVVQNFHDNSLRILMTSAIQQDHQWSTLVQNLKIPPIPLRKIR